MPDGPFRSKISRTLKLALEPDKDHAGYSHVRNLRIKRAKSKTKWKADRDVPVTVIPVLEQSATGTGLDVRVVVAVKNDGNEFEVWETGSNYRYQFVRRTMKE